MRKITFLTLLGFLMMGAPVGLMASEKKEGHEVSEMETYLAIPPVVVPMYRRGRPKGSLTIVARLKIDDTQQREEAAKIMPRLSDAYLQTANKLALSHFDLKRPVKISVISKAFQRNTNKVLGHHDALLLISNVDVHKR